MLKVGRLINDAPLRWSAAYKEFYRAVVELRLYDEFWQKNVPIPTPRREGTGVRVLSIGSGSGEVDSAILRKIMQNQSSVNLYSRVVEPSAERLRDFKDLVQQDTSLSTVKFDWRQQTVEEYFSESDGAKFDLAHAIQVLYHVQDHHATLRNMWEQLADGGYLFALLLSGMLTKTNHQHTRIFADKIGQGELQHEMWKWFPHENDRDRLQTSHITSGDVTRSLESMGISYVIAEVDVDINIAECYKEDSETGRLLLDFLTQTSNVHAHPKMRSAVLEYCLRNSSMVDDKVLFKARNAAITARKNTKK
ncbi:PREDICTED: histamine N-methyltransferase-like [Branchiostoma belcheri]|uniref:Histamine N-methyltransferase-like n=1 Tax=Branchiostoma belcheri TaxID=7741 RepID=A0A6P4ZST2_BRABE|nr:PREDICTED: histamine N-methyltransferase-like [Branchiostoma belcheri]